MQPVVNAHRLVAILSLALTLVCAAVMPGCDFGPNDPGDGDVDTNGAQPIPGPTVVIRFANLTNLAVLADVYVSSNGADLDPAVIFAPDNQLVDGVGLASTGVLVPQSTDQVEVPCTPDMIVATTGGVFRDPDSGDQLGVGAQRILQEGLVFDCGAEITFVYRDENGVFTVVVTLN